MNITRRQLVGLSGATLLSDKLPVDGRAADAENTGDHFTGFTCGVGWLGFRLGRTAGRQTLAKVKAAL